MKLNNEIVIYQTDELTRVEVQIDNETVWLSQEQMASLFGRNRVAITQHIGNIFKEGELQPEVVCKDFLLTTLHGAMQGKTQLSKIKLYNLDVIISVGYRVKSKQGTQFRIWANQILKDYLLKGGNVVYHIGASVKDLGKKWFAFTKIEGFASEIILKLKGGNVE